MEIIKNFKGKTVCHADSKNRTVEIIQKGFRTIIQFMEDGSMRIINTEGS
ncbi:MAG: hypothetical protein RR844_03530 [Clostridium sp.]